jgi:hypothetical protein
MCNIKDILLLIGVNYLMPKWKMENNCINLFVVYPAHWLAVMLYIRDMLSSNLGQNTGYHGWRLWFSSVSTGKCRDNTSIRTWPLPVTAFPIHHSTIILAFDTIYLWLYSPLLGLGRLFSFLTLYTVGRNPWKGEQPVARPLPKQRHRINAYRHPCLEWDSNPRPQC